MVRRFIPYHVLLVALVVWQSQSSVRAQPYGQPDRNQPGDEMIQEYLENEAKRLQAKISSDLSFRSPVECKKQQDQNREELHYMLGLWPMPERTPLQATVTGTYAGDGYVVENLHYQSRPRLYVTANLYRPAEVKAGERLPAVLYVCGHSGRDRDGNKTAFQSHGMWFARHGCVCLVVDTLQLGEIAAIHHGTYNRERWWWHSRGYTSAGVECWNGVRGIDYLVSRPDVDSAQIAVTGISGGGAATFWVAAADERVKVAVPVSGMADLRSYVGNRVINGHCDCMFMYNTFQWPWTRIAGLVAPRPMLFVNSDNDAIFPMDANDRISNWLERLYSFHGAGADFETLVSVGGHDYRKDIRQSVYRFINIHLKNSSSSVIDSEVDLVEGSGNSAVHPIERHRLRAFPTDNDIPKDQLNTTVDEHFVPIGVPGKPSPTEFVAWKEKLIQELRRVTFRSLPARISPAKPTPNGLRKAEQVEGASWLSTEEGIVVRIRPAVIREGASRVVLVVLSPDDVIQLQGGCVDGQMPGWVSATLNNSDSVYLLEPRGVGATRWTKKNPPNYVERSHVLLGTTVDTGRVLDVAATARYIKEQAKGKEVTICVAGKGPSAILAAYAAILENDIQEVIAVSPNSTHMNPLAPQFLNILRVCDVPTMFGLVAPKRLSLQSTRPPFVDAVRSIFDVTGVPLRIAD